VKDGKLHFILKMEDEGDEPQADKELLRTISSVYVSDDDTPNKIALRSATSSASQHRPRHVHGRPQRVAGQGFGGPGSEFSWLGFVLGGYWV